MRQAKTRGGESADETLGQTSIRVILTQAEKERCQKLAAADGRSVSSFVRQILREAMGMQKRKAV